MQHVVSNLEWLCEHQTPMDLIGPLQRHMSPCTWPKGVLVGLKVQVSARTQHAAPWHSILLTNRKALTYCCPTLIAQGVVATVKANMCGTGAGGGAAADGGNRLRVQGIQGPQRVGWERRGWRNTSGASQGGAGARRYSSCAGTSKPAQMVL